MMQPFPDHALFWVYFREPTGICNWDGIYGNTAAEQDLMQHHICEHIGAHSCRRISRDRVKKVLAARQNSGNTNFTMSDAGGEFCFNIQIERFPNQSISDALTCSDKIFDLYNYRIITVDRAYIDEVVQNVDVAQHLTKLLDNISSGFQVDQIEFLFQQGSRFLEKGEFSRSFLQWEDTVAWMHSDLVLRESKLRCRHEILGIWNGVCVGVVRSGNFSVGGVDARNPRAALVIAVVTKWQVNRFSRETTAMQTNGVEENYLRRFVDGLT